MMEIQKQHTPDDVELEHIREINQIAQFEMLRRMREHGACYEKWSNDTKPATAHAHVG
jgi:hypothetical protein